MSRERSSQLYTESQSHLVGGVNSPVRAFKSVGGNPLFIDRGEGAYVYDADGNQYVDYVGAYGPMILGHVHAGVNHALKDALDKGSCFGASCGDEIELAKLVKRAFPSIEKVRFVSSGTEAVMSAIRLARGFTGRTKLIKLSGCYHGHTDSLLAEAGSGLATLSLPGSAGVPEAVVKDTLIAPYNDLEAIHQYFEAFPGEIAGVLLEPVAGNIGVVVPDKTYLDGLREITAANGALLIFDEVMTGFRQNFGGVQAYFGIEPDITCLGKIIGGGLPVGAYGARAEIMEMVAPLGPVYQAGTLSGNPLSMAAGIATLSELQKPRFYDGLNNYTQALAEGMKRLAEQYRIPLQVNVYGSMITPFFTEVPVVNYATAKTSDTQRFALFFWILTDNGVYIPPSQFEAWFVSARHGEEEMARTLSAVEKAFQAMQ